MRGYWVDHLYHDGDKTPVVLGPLHLATGKQWVYWEELRGGEWVASEWFWIDNHRTFRTVEAACHSLAGVKRQYRLGRAKFRLCRFDSTPLFEVHGNRLIRLEGVE